MSKHDLRARPVYHRKRDSIDAHLSNVFAALAVTRFIEARTGRDPVLVGHVAFGRADVGELGEVPLDRKISLFRPAGPLIFPRLRGLKGETRLKEAHMARLIYSAIMSLDGYIADADGRFEWAAPDAEVFAFVNELERPAGTYLYGRRMYETMRYWETAHTIAGQPPVALDFAGIWQAADKIVYSTTLQSPDTARTRIERDFDPAGVRKLKEAADRDLAVGGAGLAAQAIAAGLVDEYQLFVVPAVVGGGTRALPDQVRLNLALAQEYRFGSGTVYLCYRPAR